MRIEASNEARSWLLAKKLRRFQLIWKHGLGSGSGWNERDLLSNR
jgi:hypothetical protein